MENAYIYTRVSTLIQVDGFSLEAQEAEIRAFAEARKINIVGKYTDEGKSGKNAEHRPAFTQMMEDIRSKKDNIRYVLVFKLSRFARNTSDTAKYLQELSSYGIGLLGIKDGIDTSTVTGKMIANIMGAVAEVELENIHEQTLAGRQQKARNGLWNGAQAPFGYSLKDKKLMIYPKEAETVKEIFRLYTEEGQSISYIAKKLNDENIQREQRGNVKISGFTDRTVRIILSNPVYAGMISYGRRHTVKVEGKNNETKVVKQDDESKIILVDGVHEPIVSKETFAKAEERLKKNVAHRKTRSDSTTVYPLTGLIRCPDCGKNIFGYTAPPRKKKNGKEGYYPRYISYRCISGRDRNGISCSLANKYYSGSKLETEVKEVISSMVTIPEFVELISQKIDIQTDVNSLRKKQTAIRNEITKYSGNLLQTEKRLTELDIADRHYAYMAEYAQQKRNAMLVKYRAYVEARIAELGEVAEIPALDEKEWKPIFISSMFELVRGRENNMAMLEDGDTPLISAKANNNGLKGFVHNPKKIIAGQCITLNNDGDGGAGLAYYQPANMALDSHVTALVPLIDMSAFVMLFIAKCISGLHGFFGHGLSISNPRAKRLRIMLPVTDSGEPDYEYMEQYAKNMMLRKYQQYLTFAQQRSDA